MTTLTALSLSFVGLALAVYIIIMLALRILGQDRLIAQLEANAAKAAANHAEQAKLMASQTTTIMDLGLLCEQYDKRNTLLEQLVSRWIMSRPAMTTARVRRLNTDSVELN